MDKKIIEAVLKSHQRIGIQKKTRSQSLASLEEKLFEAMSSGNTRKAESIRRIIKRIKGLGK